jgi:hypothetical protein
MNTYTVQIDLLKIFAYGTYNDYISQRSILGELEDAQVVLVYACPCAKGFVCMHVKCIHACMRMRRQLVLHVCLCAYMEMRKQFLCISVNVYMY